MAFERTHFSTDLAFIFLNMVHNGLHLVLREDTEIDMCNSEIGGYTYLADGDKNSRKCARVFKKNIAQIFLNETRDFVLSC